MNPSDDDFDVANETLTLEIAMKGFYWGEISLNFIYMSICNTSISLSLQFCVDHDIIAKTLFKRTFKQRAEIRESAMNKGTVRQIKVSKYS